MLVHLEVAENPLGKIGVAGIIMSQEEVCYFRTMKRILTCSRGGVFTRTAHAASLTTWERTVRTDSESGGSDIDNVPV